eukprot:3188383-Lingulodinium_polyedra.AAC.1
MRPRALPHYLRYAAAACVAWPPARSVGPGGRRRPRHVRSRCEAGAAGVGFAAGAAGAFP